MRAVIQEAYGAPDVLRVGEIDAPVLGEHDVLVQVRASPVTYGDIRLRAADFPSVSWLPGRLMLGLFRPKQRVPGTMFAGTVAAVGSAVTRFAPGDDVFGSPLRGTYAELVSMPQSGPIAKIPPGVSWEQAAATPYGAVTALYLMRELGELKAGQRVLIVGAAGGVGDLAVQVAHVLGAEVTAVCSRRSFERMRQLGVAHVIDHATEDFTRSDERWDIVFDTAGATTFGRCKRVLTPQGRYLTLELSLTTLFYVIATALLSRRKARIGVAIGGSDDIEEVRGLLARGALRPQIRATFPLSEIALAHTEAERRGVDGAIVVTIDPPPARLSVAR